MVRGRKCIVPICSNRYEKAENKIFIHVPRDPDIKKKWLEVLKLADLNTHHVICEDHFDLEKDAANWMYYKVMGKRIILKPGVIPHKYLDSPPPSKLPSSLSESEKKRKLNIWRHQRKRAINHPKKDLLENLSSSSNQNIQLEVAPPSELYQVYQLCDGIIQPVVQFQVNMSDEVPTHNPSNNGENNEANEADPLVSIEKNVETCPSSLEVPEKLDIKKEIEWQQEENDKQDMAIETITQVYIKEEIGIEQGDENQSNSGQKRKKCDVPTSSAEVASETREIVQITNDEYDVFSQDIAAQLRQLPPVTSVMLMEKIYGIIRNELINLQSDPNNVAVWIKTEKE